MPQHRFVVDTNGCIGTPPRRVALHRRLKMDEFLPATFRMDVKAEREAFFARQEGERHTFAHINR